MDKHLVTTLVMTAAFYGFGVLCCLQQFKQYERRAKKAGIPPNSPDAYVSKRSKTNGLVFLPTIFGFFALSSGFPLPDQYKLYPAIGAAMILGTIWWYREKAIALDEASSTTDPP